MRVDRYLTDLREADDRKVRCASQIAHVTEETGRLG